MIHLGDCRELTLDEPADAIVCDPPYGLKFMGKGWDHGVPSADVWAHIMAQAKPGAHLLAFGGTRTYHRLMVAIEDAGWEIRDCIMWVYGSGFPKSLDVSKAIDKAAGAEREVLSQGRPVKRMIPSADQAATGSWIKDNGREFVPTETAPATPEAGQWQGWGTALKPAWEPIIVARKPLVGTVAQNVLAHGCGALNIDGCRVALNGDYKCGANGRPSQTGLGDNYNPDRANQHSDEVLALFPDSKGQQGDVRGTEPSALTNNTYGTFSGGFATPSRNDTGSAARFFQCCPFTVAEREEQAEWWLRFFYCAKASKQDRGEGNTHPTVKPNALMRYLCRLVTPPGGLDYDPFAGSGSTGVAAVQEGFRFVGCDLDKDNVSTAQRRLSLAAMADVLAV